MASHVQEDTKARDLAEDPPQPLLELRDVTKSFPNLIFVLGPISVVVNEGEFVVVIGPSGAGKSTLLRTITGLTDVTSGEVLYRGSRIWGVNPKTALVFQSFALF